MEGELGMQAAANGESDLTSRNLEQTVALICPTQYFKVK